MKASTQKLKKNVLKLALYFPLLIFFRQNIKIPIYTPTLNIHLQTHTHTHTQTHTHSHTYTHTRTHTHKHTHTWRVTGESSF